MNPKPMHYHRTCEGYFRCSHCYVFLEGHELGTLIHPTKEEVGTFWVKEIPTQCEFAGRVVKNPDAYVG